MKASALGHPTTCKDHHSGLNAILVGGILSALMKTTALRRRTAVCLSVLTAAAVISASADQQTKARHDKSYTGTVKTVDPKEHTLHVEGAVLNKSFNLSTRVNTRS